MLKTRKYVPGHMAGVHLVQKSKSSSKKSMVLFNVTFYMYGIIPIRVYCATNLTEVKKQENFKKDGQAINQPCSMYYIEQAKKRYNNRVGYY